MSKYLNLPSSLKTNLGWAKYYVSHQLYIIPLYGINDNLQCYCNNKRCNSPGKHPILQNGVKGASNNIKQIEKWWAKWPNANIGIAAGKSNLIILDIDFRNSGDQSLKKIYSSGIISILPQVRTGNGSHIYFTSPHIHKSKINLLPGIDIKSSGGYVVAPPSLHKCGKNYKWTDEEVSFPIIKKDLLRFLYAKKEIKTGSLEKNTVLKGNRNSFLCSVAGSLRKFGVSHETIYSFLEKINKKVCRPKLNSSEVLSVAKSISKYEPMKKINTWYTPKKISIKSQDAPSMDKNLLPPNMKCWALDISNRMQVPFEFTITPIIVAISSILSNKASIYPKQKDSWNITPNLWGCIIAPPGSFKSPAIAESLKALNKIIDIENEKYLEEMNEWQSEKNILELTLDTLKLQLSKAIKNNKDSEIEAIKSKIKATSISLQESKPKRKRIKTNDATVEKISEILKESEESLLVYRDELSGWLASLNKQGRDGDREFYLESWNGDSSYTVDRIGRGTVNVKKLCLSVLGGIQPDKIYKYLLSDKVCNDGLMQRFQLLIQPEINSSWENIDITPDKNLEKGIFDLINNIKKSNYKSLRFTNKAGCSFNKWREVLENRLRSKNIKNPMFESHLSKYRSLVPSLALIFEVINKNGKINLISEVTEPSVLLAIKWSEYLEKHAMKIYKVQAFHIPKGVESILNKLLKKEIYDNQPIRNIQRHNWKSLKNLNEIEESIAFLEKHNWLKIETIKSNHRPSKVLKINPMLTEKLIKEEI